MLLDPPTLQVWLHVVWLSCLCHFLVHFASTFVILARTKVNCSSFFPNISPPFCLFILSLCLLLSFSTIMRTIFFVSTLPLLHPKWGGCHCRPHSARTLENVSTVPPPPKCSNLIFTFDRVKRLYLGYMSLFKFMRSGRVLSVIGIIYALSWGGSACSFSTKTQYVNVAVRAATSRTEGTRMCPSVESDVEYYAKVLIGHF